MPSEGRRTRSPFLRCLQMAATSASVNSFDAFFDMLCLSARPAAIWRWVTVGFLAAAMDVPLKGWTRAGPGPDPVPACRPSVPRRLHGRRCRVPRDGSPTGKTPLRLAVFASERKKVAWLRDFVPAAPREALIRRHFRAAPLGRPPRPKPLYTGVDPL